MTALPSTDIHPLQLLQAGLGLSLQAGGGVAGALLEPGPRGELLAGLVLELHGGAQAELHAGEAALAHPAGPLQAATAVAGLQLHVEGALLLLLLPATAGNAHRLIGAQHISDGPQPPLLRSLQQWGQQGTQQESPPDPSHFQNKEDRGDRRPWRQTKEDSLPGSCFFYTTS